MKKIDAKSGLLILPILLFVFCVHAWADESDRTWNPFLVWSTFLGGSYLDQISEISNIAVDSSGNVYVIGNTYSSDFPVTTAAFDTIYNGGSYDASYDAFVAKFDSTGSILLYATFLGGDDRAYGSDIAVDGSGNAYVTGCTESSAFPTTARAYDTTHNGDWDAFVAKLDPTGSDLLYATFIGGNNEEDGQCIALDNAGCTYVIGRTWSDGFPITTGVFDTTYEGGTLYVAKFNQAGSALDYATFFEPHGGIRDAAVNGAGNLYLIGLASADFPATAGALDTTYNGGECDAYVAKMNPTGTTLDYATFLGGEAWDVGYGIAVDDHGSAYVTGLTESIDFPTTAGAFDETYGRERDAFVAKLNATGSALEYSTFLGGTNAEWPWSIAVDDLGNAYVTGNTWSSDFPTTFWAYDQTFNGSCDVFVTKLNPTGNALAYATFLGGSSYETGFGIAVDNFVYTYVAGSTGSRDFPTTAGTFDETHNGDKDVFVAKLNLGTPPVVLSSFEAIGDQGFIDIGWITVMEINCQSWEVCRGDQDNGDYAKIAELPGHGTTELEHTYRWVDRRVVAGITYFYKLMQVDFDGSSRWSQVISASASSAVPKTYVLKQNYPNPFNTGTHIRYQTPKEGHVSLKVFNTLGQEVRTLIDGHQETGLHTLSWDGRDSSGREVASGLYLCRFNAGDFSKTIKMVLLR